MKILTHTPGPTLLAGLATTAGLLIWIARHVY